MYKVQKLYVYQQRLQILIIKYFTELENVFSQLYYLFFRFAEGKSDKEILDHLLKNSRYDKRLLPPVDGKWIFYI